MALKEELEATGNWLFRWRSYLPLFMIVPMMLAMRQFEWPLDSHNLHEVWEFSCMAVSLLGLAVRAKTVGHTPHGTSGRNTREQIASSLNTTGLYSVVRHPLYLGNFLIWLGIAMFCLIWWLVAIFALTYWLYYERIMFAEEEFLRRSFGKKFEDWASVTPAFLPKLTGWRPASLPFSFKNVLRREYTGLLGIIACFFVLAIVEHVVIEHTLVFEPIYIVLGSFAVASFVVLRTLKRCTTLLNVDGR